MEVPARSGWWQSGFTMVELLAAVCLIAILLTVALPALAEISRARTLQNASSQLRETLHNVRQTAILERRKIRILFTTSDDSPPGGRGLLDRYAIAAFDRESGAWLLTSDWRSLPQSVACNPATGILAERYNAVTQVRSPNTSAPAQSITGPYVELLPNGAAGLDPAETYQTLCLTTYVRQNHTAVLQTGSALQLHLDPLTGSVQESYD